MEPACTLLVQSSGEMGALQAQSAQPVDGLSQALCAGEAQFVGLALAGAILKDFASEICVGSITCFMELSAVRVPSPRVVHDVMSD